MLPTKHLRPFLEVAACGSVTRAAESLRRAQSAVSRSIAELERALGVTLFERRTRGLLLTEFGRTFERRVRIAFGELAQARDELARRAPDAAARLRRAPVFTFSVHERRLAVLAAFDERRHVSDAARVAHLSQPAVSMAMREIEAPLGVALFDRGASGTALSEAGAILLRHVKRALAQIRIGVSELSALRGVMEGRVTIGATPFGRPYLLPVAISRLVREHPGVTVRTVEGSMASLTAGLRSGDIDFVFGALPRDAPHEELVREELYTEAMAVLARAGHPLAARRRRDALRAALHEVWVLPQRGSPSREMFEASLASLGLAQPRVAVESSDLALIRGLMLESDMVSAASRHLFHHELAEGLLVALVRTLPGSERAIGILRRTVDHSSPPAQLLIEALRSVRTPPLE